MEDLEEIYEICNISCMIEDVAPPHSGKGSTTGTLSAIGLHK